MSTMPPHPKKLRAITKTATAAGLVLHVAMSAVVAGQPVGFFPQKAAVQAAAEVPLGSGEDKLVVGLYQGTPGLNTSLLCKVPGFEVSAESWKACGNGLPYPLVVTDLLIDKKEIGTGFSRVWLASWGWSGLFYSDDAGETFVAVQPNFPPENPGWVAVYSLDQAADGAIYLGANGGEVYTSPDGGQSWQLAGQVSETSNSTPLEILAHPTEPGVVYARIPGGGVAVSLDYAVTWHPLGGDEVNQAILDSDREIQYDLAFVAGSDGYLFAGTGRGLWRIRLQPGGSSSGTWEMLPLLVPGSGGSSTIPEVTRLAIVRTSDSSESSQLLIGTWGNGAFLSGSPVMSEPSFTPVELRGNFVRMVSLLADGGALLATERGIEQVPLSLGSATSTEDQSSTDSPSGFSLGQNYPNPFNPVTTIRFEVPKAAIVRLVVVDLLGREVARLIEGPVQPGVHEVRFDAGGLSTGIYIYRLTGPGGVVSRSLSLLR
jgi:hypothetical protein